MKKNYEHVRVRKLMQNEAIEGFDCGDADLNSFITDEAALYHEALLAETYLLESAQTSEILAYFSLANDRVSLSDFESKTEFNRFRKHRFANEKRLKSYPAAKLCRLAVNRSAKGMHLGSYLIDFAKDSSSSTTRPDAVSSQ